ncbi:sacsin N-terminal ATP-binding-like domain-containing protein [Streptomyces aidingensis]|uniref:Molecular chaperone Hsp90 n=1 Tax=Streptomyces aidingensis TaxID=910347 RepID=A0A1I1HFT2_9ACTN|nr:molecular chaperone Hsp90 [Streptomyces aidingensis]SFC22442.1 hypothetical protein SAMN05421773_102360 [Streptomyces aidingensis]
MTGSDTFDTARLRRAVLDAWTASPARFREDANTEEDLARGGYRDRLVVELAQNAADAAARAGVPGRLRLALRDGVLTAANSGDPLDAVGVESLSTLRASAKRDLPGHVSSVGRFGVGFAAVLTVTDEPAVVSRTGGVRWSLAEAARLARGAAADSPGLAAELDRRAGDRHAVPLLRLPLPRAGDARPADGYDTEVVLPLRDAAAGELAARLLAGLDDTLLLTLPGLTEVVVELPGEVRTLTRRPDGADTVIHAVTTGGAAPGERTTRWRTVTDSGTAARELLADRPLEERERPVWSVTWAVPVRPDGTPAPPPGARVVHAPTPTDDALGVPALLIASFPLEPTRRRVAPGPLTDFLLERAAQAYARLLADWRPVTTGILELVPGPLGLGEIDGGLRDHLLRLLPATPFLPPAVAPGTADGADAGDGAPPEALRAVDAEVIEGAGRETVAVLGELFPGLLPAGVEHHSALRLLGVARVPLGEAVDRVAGAERPPAWWRRLYDSLAGTDPDRLSGLPVPLADGRTTIGPRQVLLPLPGTDPAGLARLGLKAVHPEAAHPLLEKLGATPATPRAVLETSQVRAAVANSLDEEAAWAWDLGAEPGDGDGPGEGREGPGPLTAGELAETVLGLVRDAALEPGELPWLGALALPDEDGEPAPAAELVYPGSPFQQVIREGELAACDPELAARWGEQPLTAVGVQAGFALVRATDVVLDPDELEPRDTDLPEPDDIGVLDAVDVWCEDALDALPDSPLPPVAAELAGVRDLELVDDDRWPQALAMLSEPPLRDALTTPVRVRMPDGSAETVRSYTAWWLRGAPVLDGRRPAGLRAAGGDPLLAGLYEAVDTAEADEQVLRALGVRTSAAALLDEPGGAAELLARLADPDRPVTAAQLHGLYSLLAELDPEEVTLPDELRAVPGAEEPDVVAAARAAVADAPDLLPLAMAAGLPLLPVDPRRATALAALLEVPLLSAVLPAVPPAGGSPHPVPEAARALLGPSAPENYREHDELLIDGVDLEWRLTGDGTLHAATVEGLAAGLAWAAGQWPRRFELAALLQDPDRAPELATARWFD